MKKTLRFAMAWGVLTLAVACPSASAQENDAASESKRWRYFLREVKFNRLMLELAERHRPSLLVIRNATVLDMIGTEPLTGQSVVIENGRISRIVPGEAAPPETNVQHVDAANMFLVPGLVDSHTHTLVTNAHHLLNLVNGVTTVREMTGFGWMLSLRENVRTSKVLAPNMYLTGTILNHFEMEWYAIKVRDPEHARKLVREQHRAGYDFVKVHNVLRPNVYDAIFDEARKLHIDVVGHIPHDIPLAKAIERGQRTFEHLKGYYYDRNLELTSEDYVALTRGADVWNCPTLYTHRIGLRGEDVYRLLEQDEARYLSSDDRADWRTEAADGGGENHRKVYDQSRKILRDLIPIDAKLLAGTDSGGGYPMMVPGFALHEELRLLHEAGLSYEECVRAATVNAARAMRKEDEFGAIRPGLRADLLLIDGDPRKDLAALSRIAGVCVRGIWLDRAALEEIRGRLRELFADDQGLSASELPTPEAMDALARAMAELERRGAIQMDHNLRELRELLARHGRPTELIDGVLAGRGREDGVTEQGED